jgi:hypothetical protein
MVVGLPDLVARSAMKTIAVNIGKGEAGKTTIAAISPVTQF